MSLYQKSRVECTIFGNGFCSRVFVSQTLLLDLNDKRSESILGQKATEKLCMAIRKFFERMTRLVRWLFSNLQICTC